VLRKITKIHATKSSFSVAQHLSSYRVALLFDFIGFELKQHLPELPRIRIQSNFQKQHFTMLEHCLLLKSLQFLWF